MRLILLLILIGGEWYLAAMYSSGLLLALSMSGIVLMLLLLLWPWIQRQLFSAQFTEPIQFMTGRIPDELEIETTKKGAFPLARCKFMLQALYDGDKKPRKHRFVGGCSTGVRTVEVPYTPPLCGLMEMRLRKCRIYDPFRVFFAGKKLDRTIRIVVLPQEDLEESFPERPTTGEGQAGEMMTQKAGGDGDLRQIRPWVPGESQRQVHWKLTARMQETMVREWNEEKRPIQPITLEKENKEYTAEDASRFYEDLSRSVLTQLRMDSAVEVFWTGTDGIPAQMTIMEREDLKTLLIRLYESRYLWEAKS